MAMRPGIKRLFSHGEDVTVLGGFGGFEHGWKEVGPRLDWAASHFAGGSYSQETLSATVGSDVACLVSLERWSYATPQQRQETLLELRVTQAFRREEGALAARPSPCRSAPPEAGTVMSLARIPGPGPSPYRVLRPAAGIPTIGA